MINETGIVAVRPSVRRAMPAVPASAARPDSQGVIARASVPVEAAPARAKPLREAMPEVAGWIDALRDAFGREHIDPSLSAGLAGEPVFFAAERGHEIGVRPMSSETLASRVMRVNDRYYCNGCDGSCVGTEQRCARPSAVDCTMHGANDPGF